MEPSSRKDANFKDGSYKDFHYCEMTGGWNGYGHAIDYCFQDQDGYLFVENGEYGSQVNFCPICGYEAKIKIGR